MKHNQILKQLAAGAERDPNLLGYLVFGSVATGTQKEDSDIDVLTVLRENKPTSGINNTQVDGITVGNIFFTYDILLHSTETVPYLLYPLEAAKILFDREGTIKPLLERIQGYFTSHPELVETWNRYYRLQREEKGEYGYEKTTIVDVWNDLEKRYSGGKIKRQFFNSFYMTNPRIFSILKRFL
jgi:predicted nucleotidyltransferase